MAVLGATSLTGCDSIPSFIAAGTKSIFQMATSPTSWTKDTTPNQAMLRLINGVSLAPGGSNAFPTIFSATKALSLNTSFESITATVGQTAAHTALVTSSSDGSGTVQPASLSTAQITPHTHPMIVIATTLRDTGGGSGGRNPPLATRDTGSSGSGQTHTHTFPGHTHAVAASPTTLHNHTVAAHSHGYSTTQNFALAYVDMIISTKD
jgi:hypothetical protein